MMMSGVQWKSSFGTQVWVATSYTSKSRRATSARPQWDVASAHKPHPIVVMHGRCGHNHNLAICPLPNYRNWGCGEKGRVTLSM
jgi:hypothetical protein